MDEKILSDVPSEALLQALDDLEAVEKNPAYKVDMGMWHTHGSKLSWGTDDERTSNQCYVCLAGSVLARAGVPQGETVLVSNLPMTLQRRLVALDAFRTGWLTDGLRAWLEDKWYEDGFVRPKFEDVVVPHYAKDADGFKAKVREIAGILKKAGY